MPGIIANTFLSGAAGILTALSVSWFLWGHAKVGSAINGSLAGLVAITAGCHAVTAPSAVIIGSIGALVMMSVEWLLNRCHIDDAVGAVPVHAAAGLWGTIAVALFGVPEILGTGLSRWAQLQVQLTGVVTVCAVTFGTTYILLRLIHGVISLRVTAEDERAGLNVSQHGVSTELFDLVGQMEAQQQAGDFSRKVTVDPGSDVAVVAAQYNLVLDKVNDETRRAIRTAEAAELSQQQTETAFADLEKTAFELKEFNELAEGRELRMIELKTEVNELASTLGEPSRYDVSSELPSELEVSRDGAPHGS